MMDINDGYKSCIRFSREDIIAQYNVDIDEIDYGELCYLAKEKNNYYANELWVEAFNRKASKESVIGIVYSSYVTEEIENYLKNGEAK